MIWSCNLCAKLSSSITCAENSRRDSTFTSKIGSGWDKRTCESKLQHVFPSIIESLNLNQFEHVFPSIIYNNNIVWTYWTEPPIRKEKQLLWQLEKVGGHWGMDNMVNRMVFITYSLSSQEQNHAICSGNPGANWYSINGHCQNQDVLSSLWNGPCLTCKN